MTFRSRFTRGASAALLLLCLVPALVQASGIVAEPLPPVPMPVDAPAPAPPAPQVGESRIGVIASIACGLFAKASTIVPHPGVIAGAVACCALAMLDGYADPDTPGGGR